MSELVGEAIIRFKTDTTGVNPAKDGELAGKQYSKGVLGGTKRLAAGLAGAFAGEKVLEFLKGSVGAAAADEAAQRKLELAIRKNTNANDEQIKGVEEWVTKQALATGISKEELLPAYQKLVQSSGSVTKAQKELHAAMNVSAGTGKSLTSVTQALVRANNGSTAGLSRLGLKTQTVTKNTLGIKAANIAVNQSQLAYNKTVKQYGLHSDQAKIAAEKLQLSNAKLSAVSKAGTKTTLTLDQAMKQIGHTYGGQAKTQADSFQGTQARLHVTIQELEVEVGKQLIPVLTHLANFIIADAIPAVEGLGHWINQNQVWLKPLIAVIVGAVVAYKAYTIASKIAAATSGAWTKLLGQQAEATVAATGATEEQTVAQGELDGAMDANPIGLVVVALGALAAGFIYAYKHSATFRAIVDATLHGIETGFHHLLAFVSPIFMWIIHHWKLFALGIGLAVGPIGLAVALIITNFGKVETAVKLLGKAGTWLWNNAFQPALHFIVTGLAVLIDLWGHMLSALGHIPGFGWAKSAGSALENAAVKAKQLADNISKIPDHKNVAVNLVTHTDASGTVHSTGGHVPALADGGIIRARPGGTLVRVGEAGRDEAVVPLGHSAGAGIYVAGDYNVHANDFRDVAREQRRQLHLAAFGGRTPAGATP